MGILGIDIGSTTTKMAVMENDKVVFSKIVSTMSFYRDYCLKGGDTISFDVSSLDFEDIEGIISTGYGRNNVKLSNSKAINELKAHCYGAMVQSGLKDFTLLDIGGQDTKVLRVEKGVIIDIDLNDKCAASSGRFIENMARVLEVDLAWLTEQHDNPVLLNTTCAVFGESELVGAIAQGIEITRLAAGVNYSLFKRMEPLLSRFKKDTLVFTGGVAQNKAVAKYLKDLNYKEIIIPRHSQLNGAIGCCYYGQRNADR